MRGGAARRVRVGRARLRPASLRRAAAVAAGAVLAATAAASLSPSAGAEARRTAASSAASSAAANAAASGFRVVAISPANGSRGADGGSPVVVRLSGDPAPASPHPSLSPAVAGSWGISGASFVFTPAGAFAPGTRVHLAVPAGIADAAGHRLSRPVSASWSVRPLALVRAEQILAELGYLPVGFRPSTPGALSPGALAKAAFAPPAGAFDWSWAAPAELRSLWTPQRPSVVLTGALMAFQAKLGLPDSGALDSATSAALLAAARDPAPAVDRLGYSYALVSQASPETFTLWHDGKVAVESATNTGISQSPTYVGTFPVYLRYETQVMRGTNPDGQPYADPVSWVAYFAGGDAVHYIARGAYGYPQSLGCVELPWSQAASAWPLLGIGTLVTVEPAP